MRPSILFYERRKNVNAWHLTWLVLLYSAVRAALVFPTHMPTKLLAKRTIVCNLHGPAVCWQILHRDTRDMVKVLQDGEFIIFKII